MRWLIVAILLQIGVFVKAQSSANLDSLISINEINSFEDSLLAELSEFQKMLVCQDLPDSGYFSFIRSEFNYHEDSIPLLDDQIVAKEIDSMNALTPLSYEYNAAVAKWTNAFHGRMRRFIEKCLGRSYSYFPLFEPILDRNNIPLEMKYLSVMESGLNPKAVSRAGATGLWQFMYRTGKYMGLTINSYVDERRDPRLATEAACKYLNYLYRMFGDWNLVLAAYNSGEGNVRKAIRKAGGKRNYWAIRKFLPRETQNYVPKFIAVSYLMRNAEKYNFDGSKSIGNWAATDTLCLNEQVYLSSVSSHLGLDDDLIKALNPSYRRNVVPKSESKTYSICVPSEYLDELLLKKQSILIDSKKKPPIVEKEYIEYRVRKGDYLGKIASRHHCSIRQLKEWNNLRSDRLRIGQKLSILSNN